MQSRQLVVVVRVLAASIAGATLYGCTSVNPAPNKDVAKADPPSYLSQQGALCEGIDVSQFPAPPESNDNPRWISNFESSNANFRGIVDERVKVVDALDETDELGDENAHGTDSKFGLHLQATIDGPEGEIPAMDPDLYWGVNWQSESASDKRYPDRVFKDWSQYDGMVMWVRRGNPAAKARFMVQYPTPWSSPTESGGDNSCLNTKLPVGVDAGTGINGKCYAHMTFHGTAFDCWRPVKIVFRGPEANLAPAFSPGPKGFDQSYVYGTEIAFSSSSPGNFETFFPVDMWIDDVYLYTNP